MCRVWSLLDSLLEIYRLTFGGFAVQFGADKVFASVVARDRLKIWEKRDGWWRGCRVSEKSLLRAFFVCIT
jgi:hypothetical protein